MEHVIEDTLEETMMAGYDLPTITRHTNLCIPCYALLTLARRTTDFDSRLALATIVDGHAAEAAHQVAA